MSLPLPDNWNAAAYAKNTRYVSDLSGPVISLLSPRPGEDILDLGCGDGVLSDALSADGATVTAMDSSADMVSAARARGVNATVGDGAALAFDAAFDAVFSNAALHWMPDADAVLAGAFRALRLGGRFVAEQGGHGNIAAVRTALAVALKEEGVETDLADVWYFPSEVEQVRRLEMAGFVVEEVVMQARPTVVDMGMEGWLEALAGTVLAKVPGARREIVGRRVVEMLRPALIDSDGKWTVDYVRLRFKAVKP